MVLPSQQLPADEIARRGDDKGRDRIPSDHEERAVIGAVCRIEGRGDAACRQAGDGARREVGVGPQPDITRPPTIRFALHCRHAAALPRTAAEGHFQTFRQPP